MGGRLPDFAIVGAMKCGTSTLHEQLARRPGLFMSDPKEPCFFSDDDRYARGLDWYTRLFARARDDQPCGESSTHYTKLPTYPRTVERLRACLPDVKCVYLMRDPVERVVSQYIHEWTQLDVRAPLDRAVRRHERFVAYSSYALQLEPFLRAFGPDAVLPVFLERLLADPDAELERVCRFIGDPTPGPARWDRDLPAQNPSSERVRRSRLRAGLLRLGPVRALRDRAPESLRRRVRGLWQLRRRPALDPGLRAELEARIDTDLCRLGRWLGAELRCRDWRAAVLDKPLEWRAPLDLEA